MTHDRGIPHSEAYTREQRKGHAEQHLLIAAQGQFLGDTSCTQIGRTYGVPHLVAELKAMKAKLFPEFIRNGEGK